MWDACVYVGRTGRKGGRDGWVAGRTIAQSAAFARLPRHQEFMFSHGWISVADCLVRLVTFFVLRALELDFGLKM